jgi:DNA-binding response OmpR family regulator
MSTIYKIDSQEKTNLPIFRTSKQGRVLLVEPDSNIRHALKALLESQGYRVWIAADIAKACSLSRFKGYAFILFNWFMENELGLDLCKQIRSENNATPLFFYTTQDDGQRQYSSIEEKIQDYNVKSIAANALLNTIFLHLEKARNKPSLTYETL